MLDTTPRNQRVIVARHPSVVVVGALGGMGASASRTAPHNDESATTPPASASRKKLQHAIGTVATVVAQAKPKPSKKKNMLMRAVNLVKWTGRMEPVPLVGAAWRAKNKLGRAPKYDDGEPVDTRKGAGGARRRWTAPPPASADEQSMFVTDAEKHAAAALQKAEEEQQARADAADALPDREKRKRPECFAQGQHIPLWDAYGGRTLEPLLKDVDLVDARYLCSLADLGGITPRWQQVPHAARIDKSNIWRLAFSWEERNALPVLALSYPWLDASHPDRLGEQLRRVASVLSVMLKSCTSPHGTIGVFWDYACLPQRPWSTSAERQRFEEGLACVDALYMHPFTHVLKMTGPVPKCDDPAGYSNSSPYERRGWCFFESHAAAIVKDDDCLWDYAEAAGETTLEGLRSRLRCGRRPPLSPGLFREAMEYKCGTRELCFTDGADMQTVITMYAAGFEKAFSSFARTKLEDNTLYYQALEWGSADVAVLTTTLTHLATQVTFEAGPIVINMTDNEFEPDEEAQLQEAVAGCDGIQALWL